MKHRNVKFGMAMRISSLILCFCFLPGLNVLANGLTGAASPPIQYYYNTKSQLEFTVLPDKKIYRSIYDANGNLSATRLVTKSIELPNKMDLSAPSYDIYAYNVNDTAKKVAFPTWTEHQGQDDIEWIAGEKVAPGIWKARVVFKKHNSETGLYLTHVYVDGGFLGATSVVVSPPQVQIQIPDEVFLNQESYEVAIHNVNREVHSVSFPTWTEAGGQDDVIWQAGVRVSPTTWKVKIPFVSYKYLTGTYNTHIYAFDSDGNTTPLSGHSIIAKSAVVSSSNIDLTLPSFEVYAYGVNPEAKKVAFPTWTLANGQDDLRGIEGEKISDGLWKATVRLDEHNREQGIYATHVYADDKFFGAGDTNVLPNKSFVKAPLEISLAKQNYEMVIEGVNGEVTSVFFPTWTSHNGQDEVEWIQGIQTDEHTWKARVEFTKHNNEVGEYITHIYSTDQFGNKMYINSHVVHVK